MSKDYFNRIFPAAITVTALSGFAILLIAFSAPDPCPPLLAKAFDAFLQVFVLGAIGTVTLYSNKPGAS